MDNSDSIVSESERLEAIGAVQDARRWAAEIIYRLGLVIGFERHEQHEEKPLWCTPFLQVCSHIYFYYYWYRCKLYLGVQTWPLGEWPADIDLDGCTLGDGLARGALKLDRLNEWSIPITETMGRAGIYVAIAGEIEKALCAVLPRSTFGNHFAFCRAPGCQHTLSGRPVIWAILISPLISGFSCTSTSASLSLKSCPGADQG